MVRHSGSFNRDCQSKLKRHIETGSAGTSSVQLNARQIVNGIFGFGNQSKDAFKAAFAEWNLQSGSGGKTKRADGSDISQQ